MNIVLYCPARLPVREYGGTERVVVWLARGLAERGHRVRFRPFVLQHGARRAGVAQLAQDCQDMFGFLVGSAGGRPLAAPSRTTPAGELF